MLSGCVDGGTIAKRTGWGAAVRSIHHVVPAAATTARTNAATRPTRRVRRARETTLNRDVALKILPHAFAADPDRLARFTREAQTLAALNHPNIAHLYGLEQSCIVMELVDGEDLARRIARGPIPIDESVAIAVQIADALEAAHEQGIIHRDLKPANVKVTPEGQIKVLDFGPRRCRSRVSSPTSITTSRPTASSS